MAAKEKLPGACAPTGVRPWARLLAAVLAIGAIGIPATPRARADALAAENLRLGLGGNSAPDRALAEPTHCPEMHRESAVSAYDFVSDSAYATKGPTVIGKVKDLQSLRSGENTLLKHLQGDLGSPKANWGRNAGVLRQEMGKGLPIRDATVDPSSGALINNTGFLRAERNLLDSRGWIYNQGTTMWYPPLAP